MSGGWLESSRATATLRSQTTPTPGTMLWVLSRNQISNTRQLVVDSTLTLYTL